MVKPLDPQFEFNISNLKPISWNPYWPPPVITNPETEQLVYWENSQDPYDLDEDFDPENFYINRLRQGLPKSNPQPNLQPTPMDQNNPSHEMIISYNSWLGSLGYDFTPGVDNSHLNLSNDD